MQRWRGWVVPAWSAALALVVLAPLLGRGYVLTYDMVWVPQLDLDRVEVWGLGTGLPRAVPSDAVAALLGHVVPAEIVQRLLLFLAFVLLSSGVARLLGDRRLAAQLAGATFAVWNPYVAERLVLGQWPMLLALAAFPWLVWALNHRAGPQWPIVVLALAGTALTPASGVMGVIVGVVAAWRITAIRVVVVAALLNAPWIVAGLRDVAQARTDPAAAGLFELQAEGVLGHLGSALTLGGIWNTEVVPTSRTLGVSAVLVAVIGAVTLLGLLAMCRDDRRLVAVLGVCGSIGLAVAVAGWLAPDLIARIIEDVPAGGLVRDGTRWLALLVPLEAVGFGAGVGVLIGRVSGGAGRVVPAAVLAALLPIAALPDAAWGVAGRLEPVTYPSAWASAREVIERTQVPGDILVLPFSAYRRPQWNGGSTVLDPAGRYFDRTTVTNDELEVSGTVIRGEDRRAAAIGTILDGGDVLAGLARRGIGVVVVETDAPGARAALRTIAGAEELDVDGKDVRVFTIPGAQPRPVAADDRRDMILAWGAAGATLLLGVVGLLRRTLRRLHRKPAEHRPGKVSKT
ncbi:MAG: hypothetical protein ABW075_01495 [Aeromicrobium sp.]